MAVFLASRLVTFGAAATAAIAAHLPVGGLLGTWDGAWYLAVARHGYPHVVPEVGHHVTQSTVGFFPLFPVVIRALAAGLGLTYLGAGLLAATLFGAIATVLLWLLVNRLWGAERADQACLLWCFFPGSFVLSLVYAEGLMLSAALGCLLALLSRRWWLAGVLGALASAARPNAVVLVACCAFASGMAIIQRREWRSLIAPLLSPLGVIGFFAFLWQRTGSPTAWFKVQHDAWHQHLDPLVALREVHAFLSHPLTDVRITSAVVGLVFLVVTAILLLRSRPPGVLLIWAVGTVALALLTSPVPPSAARSLLTAFPLVVVLCRYLRGTALSTVLAVSGGLLAGLTALTVATLAITP